MCPIFPLLTSSTSPTFGLRGCIIRFQRIIIHSTYRIFYWVQRSLGPRFLGFPLARFQLAQHRSHIRSTVHRSGHFASIYLCFYTRYPACRWVRRRLGIHTPRRDTETRRLPACTHAGLLAGLAITSTVHITTSTLGSVFSHNHCTTQLTRACSRIPASSHRNPPAHAGFARAGLRCTTKVLSIDSK